jgi:flagellar hook-associated protein 1
MPVSSFMGLQTTLRGLLAQQRALDVTGHNITNAGTAGFSRQEAVMAAAPALRVQAGAVQGGGGSDLGAGVDVLEYSRIRDTFLDAQFRGQNTVLGDRSATTSGLERAELALAEPGDAGIASLLGEFWNGWADLANAPENQAARQALVDQGRTLAEAIKTLDTQLVNVGQQALAEYADLNREGGEIDAMAEEIARLNRAINSSVESGTTPNDLLDRRDLLVDRLSALGTVSVAPVAGFPGSVIVTLGGEELVNHTTSATFPITFDPGPPGGRLGALQRIGQTTVPDYREDLRVFAQQLVADVNGAHPGFFGATAANEAATIAVAATAATLAPGSSGAPGHNDQALAAAALRGGAADGRYARLVTKIGGDLRNARREESNAQVLTNSVDDRRQSVSGVSMDEEMANLVRFQRGYQASARAMNTASEILDILINRTGRVGL